MAPFPLYPKSISDHKDRFFYKTGIFFAGKTHLGEFTIASPVFLPRPSVGGQ